MKRVFFFIPTLGGGGAERVMLHILKSIDRSKFEPYLVLFKREGELLSDMPSCIKIKALKNKEGVRWRLWGLTWIILTARFVRLLKAERPDVVLSFMWYTNLVVLMAKIMSRTKCCAIVSERYGLSFSYEGKLLEFVRKTAIRFLYPKADGIIVNAKEMGEQLKSLFHIAPEKIKVIYNPVDIQKINQFGKEDCNHPWFREDIPVIIAAGRLTQQKGFDYLLKAFSIVLSEGIACRIVIMGKGKEEGFLKKLAKQLNISDRVDFLGFQQNPYRYMLHSTVFVLSSLYEGFPNVLLEALALGVPSIAARCPTGPEEIIADGVNGLLVPPADEKSLAEAIKRLLTDEALRKRLGEAGKKCAEDFRVAKIIKEYEAVIEGVCAESAAK